MDIVATVRSNPSIGQTNRLYHASIGPCVRQNAISLVLNTATQMTMLSTYQKREEKENKFKLGQQQTHGANILFIGFNRMDHSSSVVGFNCASINAEYVCVTKRIRPKTVYAHIKKVVDQVC